MIFCRGIRTSHLTISSSRTPLSLLRVEDLHNLAGDLHQVEDGRGPDRGKTFQRLLERSDIKNDDGPKAARKREKHQRTMLCDFPVTSVNAKLDDNMIIKCKCR